jgi:aryl-alcohol dehydrogenase-like predicted oxidoreductase
MQYRQLGHTSTEVSQLCLGSMTWGTQNTPAEAFEQIDCALEHGVNFIDTAEMYPTTPLSPETQGRTEAIIGEWLNQSGKRDKVIIATKVTGNGPKWIDDGKDIDAAKIDKAINASLQRLQTDYIDVYQLHWPNRGSYHFRQSWQYDVSKQDRELVLANMHEVLNKIDALVKAGKIRHLGLSNETCWGTSQFLQIAAANNLPRVVSIQNEYSLMQRLFDLDLAELAQHEKVGLLAFSPLAAGPLSGKYENGCIPEGSRRSMNDNLSGRYTDKSKPALQRYLDVARKHEIEPAQLALAFCMTRPFMTSVIIGATSMQQLRMNLGAAELTLTDDVMSDIAAVHRDYPVPM